MILVPCCGGSEQQAELLQKVLEVWAASCVSLKVCSEKAVVLCDLVMLHKREMRWVPNTLELSGLGSVDNLHFKAN